MPPNGPDGFAAYTIPAATFPAGNSLMDSLTIAKHIESQYPSPPAHMDDPRVTSIANEMIPKIMGPLRNIYVRAQAFTGSGDYISFEPLSLFFSHTSPKLT